MVLQSVVKMIMTAMIVALARESVALKKTSTCGCPVGLLTASSITNAKAKGQDRNEVCETVEQNSSPLYPEKHPRGISDLFGFHGVSRFVYIGPMVSIRQKSPKLGQPLLVWNSEKMTIVGIFLSARTQGGIRMARKTQSWISSIKTTQSTPISPRRMCSFMHPDRGYLPSLVTGT